MIGKSGEGVGGRLGSGGEMVVGGEKRVVWGNFYEQSLQVLFKGSQKMFHKLCSTHTHTHTNIYMDIPTHTNTHTHTLTHAHIQEIYPHTCNIICMYNV